MDTDCGVTDIRKLRRETDASNTNLLCLTARVWHPMDPYVLHYEREVESGIVDTIPTRTPESVLLRADLDRLCPLGITSDSKIYQVLSDQGAQSSVVSRAILQRRGIAIPANNPHRIWMLGVQGAAVQCEQIDLVVELFANKVAVAGQEV